MNKVKMIIFLLLSFTYLEALSSSEIDEVERDVKRLSTVVNDYYTVIKSNRIVGVDDILNKYSKNPKAKLIQEWFFIISQYSRDSNLVQFMNESKYKIGLYLQQLNVDTSNAISSEEYKRIQRKLKRLDSSNRKFIFLNYKYVVDKNIYLRRLPIISTLTNIRERKLFKVLKKKTVVQLLYKIVYETRDGKSTNWGYVQLKSGKKGWVNLKNTHRIY